MNTVKRCELAESLLELTLNLKRSLESRELGDMSALQEQRAKLMQALFAGSVWDEGEDQRWISVVQQVQTLNQELLGLAKQAREAIGEELAVLRRTRRAESKYAEIYDGPP